MSKALLSTIAVTLCVTVSVAWAKANRFVEAKQVERIIVEGRLISSSPFPEGKSQLLVIGYKDKLYNCLLGEGMASCFKPEFVTIEDFMTTILKPQSPPIDIAADIIRQKGEREKAKSDQHSADIATDIIASAKKAFEIGCPTEETLIEGEEVPEECLGPRKKIAKEVPSQELLEVMYYEFPGTLLTSLKGSRRFLQIGIAISTQYEETLIENIETHMPAITADISATLSDYTEEETEGSEARLALAEDLRSTIDWTLSGLEGFEGFGGIKKVHITSFVLH